jgi:uncharacterized protein with GYD domain
LRFWRASAHAALARAARSARRRHPPFTRRLAMATFISLLNFTDQGIRNIKDSPDRYGTFRAMAEKLGVAVKAFYYTVGRHDMIVIMEGSDEAVTTALLKAGSLGNVRSETLRGFSVDEAKRMIGKLP